MKLFRTSTIPLSIKVFCSGLLRKLCESEGFDVRVVSSPGEDLDYIAKHENVKTYAVAMERHISPIKDLKSLIGLIKTFHSERPDLVHSITPKAGLLSMIAAWICRVPVRVHTFTGLVFPTSTGLKRKVLMATDWITCACATHIIPEGEGVKRDLLNNGITHKTLKVLGHGNCRGIDLDRFNTNLPEVKDKADKIRKEGIFSFLCVGRLVGDKGINELIEAFKRFNNEYPASRLILVGSPEQDLDPLKTDTLIEIDSNENIEAVGQQSDIRPWFAASDCFIFPSYREGFPNVVIEAGAMGLPSIVTDINGSNEIIIEGKNGTIVPSKDSDSLYEAMKRMITDENWRLSMSKNARDMIASRYEQSYVQKCLIEFYKEITPKTLS